MHFLKKYFFLSPFLLAPGMQAQEYPQHFFRMPVDTVVRLAGNFGEIRQDHFHYGWDIRTGNHEGLKVVAAGDGYVSRIKTGPYGYGKVIYITHPNGYVSVYGHLSAFNDTIGKYVKDAQYRNESYEVELFPKKEELPVKKGEFIALSGNTGNSSGPHLHFEIRDEKTEEIINPYFFGLNIPDTVKPVMQLLAVYPLETSSLINGADKRILIPLKGKNGLYHFKGKDSIVVKGGIGFGLQGYDGENGPSGYNQVYSMELQIDGKRIYYWEMTRFAFDQTRYVNCHIDYREQRVNNRDIQKAFLLPGNKFPVYRDVVNSGLVNFQNDSIHQGTFIVKDFYHNISRIDFTFRISNSQQLASSMYVVNNTLPLATAVYDEPLHINISGLSVEFPAHAVYENTDLYVFIGDGSVSSTRMLIGADSVKNRCSPLFKIGDDNVPLHDYMDIVIRCNPLPDSLYEKVTMVSSVRKGPLVNEGGEFVNGTVKTRSRTFGVFTLVLDTLAPKIKPPKLLKNQKFSTLKTVEFKVSDNLTGIKKYRVELDGKWFLFEYEPKKNILLCKNNDLPSGKHLLRVTVSDGRNNTSMLEYPYDK